MSQRTDPVAALRAVVDANARYVAATGREMDVVVLHPEHARQLLKLLENPLREVYSVTLPGVTSPEQAEAFRKAFQQGAYEPGKGGVVGLEPGDPDPLMSPSTSFPDYSPVKRRTYQPKCEFRLPDPACSHETRTVFPGDGSVFCHDCNAFLPTDKGAIEKHRRTSSVESDKSI